MVSVRRPNQPASGGSVFSVRNVVILLVLVQVVRLALPSSSNKSSPSKPTLSQVLQDSKTLRAAVQKEPNLQAFHDAFRAHSDAHEGADSHHHEEETDHHDPLDHVLPDLPTPEEADPHHHAIEEPAATEITDLKAVDPIQKAAEDAAEAAREASSLQQDKLRLHGTGPTQKGYVNDFAHQRGSPAFRDGKFPHYEAMEERVQKLLKLDQPVHHCEFYTEDRRLTQRPQCMEDHKFHATLAYNSATFERYLCGQRIPPKSALHLDTPCDQPGRVFSKEPDLTNMPAIQVQSQPVHHTEDHSLFENVQCDVPCRWEKDMQGTDRFIDGTDWKIFQSMDDPYFNDNAKVERTAYRQNLFYSTTSLSSSVPLSYFDLDKYNYRNAPALDWSTAAQKATWLLDTACMSGGNRRHRWATAVDKYVPLAAYGKCNHNTEVPPGESLQTPEGRVKLAKHNRIVLAMEAGNEKDHMSDITWEAFLSGAVPAYMGPSNANEILPEHSFIDGSAFNDYDKFAAYVKEVSESKELWESYQTWRSNSTVLKAFEDRFLFTRTAPECRVCRWAYAKMYGLGWDHQRQVVTKPKLPRKLCMGESYHVITQPFQEMWKERDVEKGHDGTDEYCDPKDQTPEAVMDLDTYRITREVVSHDGVTDIIIKGIQSEASNDDVLLRLDFPEVDNRNGAYFRNTHTMTETERGALVSSATIQDANSKATVIASWVTEIRSPEPGILELVVQRIGETFVPNEHRRLRVIVEDMSELHDKVTEFYPSPFADRMTKDFVDPIEFFYMDSASA